MDDNSSFGADFSAQYYPKVSAAWVISEELFWNLPAVNTLRLRSAMGRASLDGAALDEGLYTRSRQPRTWTFSGRPNA